MLLTFIQKAEIFSQNDKAIKGYDPVAYFVDANPDFLAIDK